MRAFYHKFIFLAFAFFLCLGASAQKDLTGKVSDSLGNPIANATVKEKNKPGGTTTDKDGQFKLIVSNNAILEISSVGYSPLEVKTAGLTEVRVQMGNQSATMSEVVVTALGVRREKRNLTYSTQEVKGDELVRSKEPNLVNAIAGKVSGVQITSSSGAPGSSSRIVIRGATSIYGDNQALIVIDGVPINNDETGNLYSGPGTNRLADIDPSIIENINVLKGSAATAMYGSAGARGVVIITTKGGALEKKPTVTFSSDLSFENPLLPKKQMKYAQGTRGIFYDGEAQKTSLSWGPDMDTLKVNGAKAAFYNPYDLFFKTGVTTNNTISVGGGGASSSYFLSYSYFDQKGSVPNTDFKRHAIFAKYGTRMARNFNSTFQINYTNSDNDRMPEGYVLENPIWTVYAGPVSWNPLPYLYPDGTQRVYRYSRNNPYWVLDNIYNKSNVNRFIPVFTFDFTPTKWLTFTERVGADIYSEQDKYKEAPSSALATPGQIIEQNQNFRQFNSDFIISARKSFGDFNTDLIVGNNIQSVYYQTYYEKGVGLTVSDFDNIGSASTITASENHSLQRKVGFYGQATIDYKRFLVLSLTGRYDGSSVLATDKNFYPYGSVAGSFIFSELLPAGIKNTINFAKLRLSYATVGNDGVGPYALTTPYVTPSFTNINFPFQGQAGFLLSQTLGNPDLKNERLNEYEIGLEAKMFHNRIGFEISYFDKKTVDGIIPGVAIAPSTGYTGTTVNTASIQNKGIEVLLNATPVRGKKFSWDLTFNFSQIKNKVLALYPGTDQLGNGFTQIIVGQPYGVKYGARFKRNAQGEKLIDANGLPIRDDQDGIVGNITPDWLAGLTNNFHYGQFSLSFFFDMKMGGDIENNVDGYGAFYGTTKASENRAPQVIKGVSEADGKPNTIPADMQTYYQNFGGMLESVIQDGTYIKLRNVSLAYDFKPSFLAKTPLKSAAIILTGRNLWIYSPHFTGADPEVSSFGSSNGSQGIYSFSAPTSRSYAVTLRVSF